MHKRDDVSVYAVILVGGAGKRLKPLSTDERPKAFLSVTRDRKTMFARTLKRITRVIPEKMTLVVANRRHVRLVKKDFPGILNRNLIAEPFSRNTAPAITVAALALGKIDPAAIMVVMAADQYITDDQEYTCAICRGIDFVKANTAALLTLGVRPDSPSTEFGYIKLSNAPSSGQPSTNRGGWSRSSEGGIYKAEKFVEKPGLRLAKKYLESAVYLWNTGPFIFTAGTIIGAMGKYSPAVTSAFKAGGPLMKIYKKMPYISIDHAVMEKSKNVYCVKGDYRWQDIGSFGSLKAILKLEARKFIEKDGKIIRILP